MNTSGKLRMTLIPPDSCTDIVNLDIRAAIFNDSHRTDQVIFSVYLDEINECNLISTSEVDAAADCWASCRYKWKTAGNAGVHKICVKAVVGDKTFIQSSPIEIVPSKTRSLGKITGAWAGITHWCEKESRYWKDDIKEMDNNDWRETVRGMCELGMKTIVIQEVFRNQMYVGKHDIERIGYKGVPYYPSELYEGKMDITADDPIGTIFDEADRLGSHVLPGVGMYAWFDFTEESLKWHKEVAMELWQKYGHHKSFYGWYVAEEIHGNLGANDERRSEIVLFFKEFKEFVSRFSPDKPVMLASNCHDILGGYHYWPRLLENLDILCPFGFHRMPLEDITGQEAADLLQTLCDQADSHLWMDMEIFLFEDDAALYPRPIEQIVDDMQRFPNFEKILCYQYPGLINAHGQVKSRVAKLL